MQRASKPIWWYGAVYLGVLTLLYTGITILVRGRFSDDYLGMG